MTEPRDLLDVLRALAPYIPDEEQAFRSEWDSLIQSVCYASPELMPMRWGQGADLLVDYLPDSTALEHDWQRRVVAIWMNQENEHHQTSD